MIKKHLWSKAFEYGLDEVDVKLLNILSSDMSFLKSDFMNISDKVGLSTKEIRERIQTLRDKKIITRDRISLIAIPKVWDLYLFTFMKIKLETPVDGLKIKTPIGWSGIMRALISAKDKFKTNMIRQAFTLYGTDWDLLLLRTVNDQVDGEDFLEFIVEEGWMEAGWTIKPLEGTRYLFDPIGVPSVKEYKDMVEKPLLKKGMVWKKAIENELDEKDVRLLNILSNDSHFSEIDYEKIAKIAGENKEVVKERIKVLKSKGILMKERISCLDIFELWDSYFITFIKAKNYEKIFSEIEKKSKQANIVRQSFIMWGGTWNIALFTTTNRPSGLENFINPILKKYPAEDMWTIKQQDIDEKIFDPVAVPTLDEYRERVGEVLRKRKQSV